MYACGVLLLSTACAICAFSGVGKAAFCPAYAVGGLDRLVLGIFKRGGCGGAVSTVSPPISVSLARLGFLMDVASGGPLETFLSPKTFLEFAFNILEYGFRCRFRLFGIRLVRIGIHDFQASRSEKRCPQGV